MSDNKEFINSMDNVTDEIIANLAGNMKTFCLRIVRDGKIECPVDQGPLRASIDYDVEVEEKEVIGYVGSDSEIAPYVHEGTGIYAVDGNGRKTPWKYKAEAGKYKGWHITKGQKPNPFLERAVIKNKDKFSKILAGGK